MTKKYLKMLLCIVFFGIFFSIASAGHIDNEKVDKIVKEKLKTEDKVRVILEFEKGQFLNKASDNDGRERAKKITGKNEIISYEINSAELNELAKNPGIKRIYYDFPVKSELSESTELIGAQKTWNKKIFNSQLKGNGQSICIIDTGIYAQHPDLVSNYKEGYDFLNNDSIPDDENGHGTHIAGIVSSNGRITGVAPESNILSAKVLDAQGFGRASDVIKGVEWCIAEAGEFNVSVISLSLGTDSLYSEFCDDILPSAVFNEAIEKNISVVVSSGNGASINELPWPACLKNVIRVAASDKNDDFWGQSNRNSKVKLIAPGVNINSTWLDGSYRSHSGTSMASPHVTGAILLLNQYLSGKEERKTPIELENVLLKTGKTISDSTTGLNFSRIDIDNALLSLDSDKPEVVLEKPSDNERFFSRNLSFSCMANDWQLSKAEFFLWKDSALLHNESRNIEGENYSFEVNLDKLEYGNYEWNCLFEDALSNRASASENHTFEIDNFNVHLGSPENKLFSNQSRQEFTCRAETDSPVISVVFSIWNNVSIVYNENKSFEVGENKSNFSYDFENESNYEWNCVFENSNGTKRTAENNFTLNYDKTAPAIELIFPEENHEETSKSANISFIYIKSDNFGIERCDLLINDSVASTNSNISMEGENQSFSYALALGNYTWSITCLDKAGNSAQSTGRNITINSLPFQQIVQQQNSGGGDGGGGGGGGSGSIVVNITKNITAKNNLTENNEFVNGSLNNVENLSVRASEEENNDFKEEISPGITGSAISANNKIATNKLIIYSLLIIGCIATLLYIIKNKASILKKLKKKKKQ